MAKAPATTPEAVVTTFDAVKLYEVKVLFPFEALHMSFMPGRKYKVRGSSMGLLPFGKFEIIGQPK